MVYLEKEVMQMNGEVDEFQYSNEYIDSFFDVSQQGSKGKFTDGQLEDNLDMLMGVQEWRKGKLGDVAQLEKEINELKADSKKRLRLEYLLGRKPVRVYRR